MSIYGADEAGRGPVIGSMFVTVVKVSSLDEIQGVVDDSKALTFDKIKQLAEENSNIEKSVKEVTPNEIDNGNITTLTIEKMSEGLRELNVTTSDKIYADSCLSNEDKFEKQLSKLTNLPQDIITGENKADEKYDIVSLASIFSKQYREQHISILQEKADLNIGSGYPSDPNTRDYLKQYILEHGELPPFTRKSWSTSEDLLETYNNQKSLDSF